MGWRGSAAQRVKGCIFRMNDYDYFFYYYYYYYYYYVIIQQWLLSRETKK